jgi:hypothetical protein
MTSSAIDSQFGFSPETTIGTRVTPATFLEYVPPAALVFHCDRIISKGVRPGRRTQGRWRPGRKWVDGNFTVELGPQSIGKLLKWAFGAVSTAGSDPYTHTFTPGTLDDEAMTLQFAVPDEAGTIRVHEYQGCQCTGWQIACKVNEFATMQFSVYGMNEDRSQSLASASYPSTWNPFTFVSGALSIAGSGYDVDDITLTGNNGLITGRHKIRATTPQLPVQSREGAFRQYGGVVNGDYLSNAAYDRFVNGTEAAVSMVFSDGSSAQLTIAGNARFDGDTPNVRDMGITKQALPFVFTSLTSDAAAITATLVNADSTP